MIGSLNRNDAFPMCSVDKNTGQMHAKRLEEKKKGGNANIKRVVPMKIALFFLWKRERERKRWKAQI